MQAASSALIRVPLLNGGEAIISEAAHARILGMGYSGPWFLWRHRKRGAHVRCCRARAPGFKPAFAWRVVLGEASGWRGRVVYRDGNPLNLTPANVTLPMPRRKPPTWP